MLLACAQPKDSKNAAEDDYAGLSSTPRVLLSNEQPYFDLLFDLLGVGGDVARLVVKLLARLPINQGLSDTIKNLTTAASKSHVTCLGCVVLCCGVLYCAVLCCVLMILLASYFSVDDTTLFPWMSDHLSLYCAALHLCECVVCHLTHCLWLSCVCVWCGAGVDWNNLLPRDSVMKLSYTLKIVRNQVIPPPLPQVATGEGGAPDPTAAARQAAILAVYTKWSEMFLAKGGFQHLAGIFISTKIEDLVSTTLTQECMFHLLELINYFIGSPHLTSTFAARHGPPSLCAALLVVCVCAF